jgi:hypothetical protein
METDMASLWTGQWQGQWEGRLIGPIDPNFLTGTTGFSVAASGLVRGAGIIAGQAYFALDAAGNIENGNTTIPAYGTAGFTLSAAGTVIGALLASGSAAIVLDTQGDAYLAINAAGDATLSLGAAGSLHGLGAVLGSGEVALGAQASLTGIGALSGSSDISVLPNGNIFSPLWTSGQTGVSIGIQGDISGAAWATGVSSFDIQAQGLLHGIGAISGAAWFVLRARHRDLTHYQRAYVTSVVESLYVKSVADQTIAVAAQNNLSVLDALQVVTAKHSGTQLVARNERKVSADRPARAATPKPEKVVRNIPAYSVSVPTGVFCASKAQTAVVFSEFQNIVATSAENTMFIQHKPKRASLEQTPTS